MTVYRLPDPDILTALAAVMFDVDVEISYVGGVENLIIDSTDEHTVPTFVIRPDHDLTDTATGMITGAIKAIVPATYQMIWVKPSRPERGPRPKLRCSPEGRPQTWRVTAIDITRFWEEWFDHHLVDKVHTTIPTGPMMLGADWQRGDLMTSDYIDPAHAEHYEWAVVLDPQGQIPGHPIVLADQLKKRLVGFDPGFQDFTIDDLDIKEN